MDLSLRHLADVVGWRVGCLRKSKGQLSDKEREDDGTKIHSCMDISLTVHEYPQYKYKSHLNQGYMHT